MNIIGIEVIRGNSVTETEALPGQKIDLTYGEMLRISVSADYQGLAGKATLYGAIGVRGLVFNEKLAGQEEFNLPDSPAGFSPCAATVDIVVTSDISPGTDYDIYCKILEYPEAGLPEVDNVINIVGLPPTYELLEHTIYPSAYVYDGDVETAIFTCTTDAFTPSAWVACKLAAEVEKQVKQNGGRIMELKVYVDKSPLLWTNFRIEATATPLPGTAAGHGIGAIAIPIWAAILIACLAIAALIIVITWAVKTIVGTFTHQALSEEIKKTWSRESLISVIGDFEAKLERTPTSAADLEKKSDQELRDYCNSLAKEIVPPAGVGLGLAIAGVGLAAVGILVALGLSARGK